MANVLHVGLHIGKDGGMQREEAGAYQSARAADRCRENFQSRNTNMENPVKPPDLSCHRTSTFSIKAPLGPCLHHSMSLSIFFSSPSRRPRPSRPAGFSPCPQGPLVGLPLCAVAVEDALDDPRHYYSRPSYH